ncbi:MFS transporter [Brooklawnia cerclae]|uniref:MFS family permease n=1 Tax=Brooklawnia cerclae TaxID=349934 RepID=A0ABX0SDR6_9ACTN|nr:MFS family permease [Brooklawnia cerclae]
MPSIRHVERVFWALTFARWFPIGLVAGVYTLLATERGLTVAQIGVYSAVQGAIILLLELPTSGFADALGRKPVLVVAGAFGVLSGLAYLLAHDFAAFVLASALMGVFRALDSGPLEAWFVDAVRAIEPGRPVGTALARSHALLGIGIASGSLLSGGLIAWHPFRDASALDLPVVLLVIGQAVDLAMIIGLMSEPRTTSGRSGASTDDRRAQVLASVRATPGVIASGLRLLRSSGVLRGLLVAETLWVVAMFAQENLMPLRLADFLGSEARAGVWLGPLVAVGWLGFALASWLAGRFGRILGFARTALVSRLAHGIAAALMGVMPGAASLAGAYLVTYSLHGANGTAHATLLHDQADASNRATVLSVDSMATSIGVLVFYPLLGAFAERWGNGPAMVCAGLVGAAGLVGYLPAVLVERRGLREGRDA